MLLLGVGCGYELRRLEPTTSTRPLIARMAKGHQIREQGERRMSDMRFHDSIHRCFSIIPYNYLLLGTLGS